MRSNPVGRIVRNLLEADRKKAAYKEWVDNLFEPVRGVAATRGRFGAGSRTASAQLWATTHRGPLLAAAGGALVALRSLRR